MPEVRVDPLPVPLSLGVRDDPPPVTARVRDDPPRSQRSERDDPPRAQREQLEVRVDPPPLQPPRCGRNRGAGVRSRGAIRHRSLYRLCRRHTRNQDVEEYNWTDIVGTRKGAESNLFECRISPLQQNSPSTRSTTCPTDRGAATALRAGAKWILTTLGTRRSHQYLSFQSIIVSWGKRWNMTGCRRSASPFWWLNLTTIASYAAT